jgi:hypothetical protein
MVRKMIKVALFGMLGAMISVMSYGGITSADDKKDEKVPTISEIMTKGHKGTDAYLAKIKTAAKGEKWDDAKEYAKTLAFFGESLGKNKAPKGEDASWEKLTKKYDENTKAVVKGVDDKDAKAVNKALGNIGSSCGECHKAHKP